MKFQRRWVCIFKELQNLEYEEDWLKWWRHENPVMVVVRGEKSDSCWIIQVRDNYNLAKIVTLRIEEMYRYTS